VRRDVPSIAYFLLIAVLLLIPPAAASIRRRTFETRRWQESDYPPITSGDDD